MPAKQTPPRTPPRPTAHALDTTPGHHAPGADARLNLKVQQLDADHLHFKIFSPFGALGVTTKNAPDGANVCVGIFSHHYWNLEGSPPC